MTSRRSYRRLLAAGEALAELERNAGTQFWPVAVEAFCSLGVRSLAA